MADSFIRKLLGIFNRAEPAQVAAAGSAPVNPSSDESDSGAGTIEERRASPRRWGNPVLVEITEVSSEKEPQRGWVMNRSSGGLGLSSTNPVTIGSLLRVRAVTAGQSTIWVQVQVMNSNESSGRWMLSCRYVETQSQESVSQFG